MKYIFNLRVKINCIKQITTDKLNVSNNFLKTSSYNLGLLYIASNSQESKDLLNFSKLGLKVAKRKKAFLTSVDI